MIETALIDSARATLKGCSCCKKFKPPEEFHRDKNSLDGRAYYCKECANLKSRTWHSENTDNLDYKTKKKQAYVKNRFGISLSDYQDRLQKQDYKCAICKVELPTSGYFTHLDHCHKTGKIRQFLCTNCNRGLGHFQDNKEFLMEAVKYLQAHTEDGTQKEGSGQ